MFKIVSLGKHLAFRLIKCNEWLDDVIKSIRHWVGAFVLGRNEDAKALLSSLNDIYRVFRATCDLESGHLTRC